MAIRIKRFKRAIGSEVYHCHYRLPSKDVLIATLIKDKRKWMIVNSSNFVYGTYPTLADAKRMVRKLFIRGVTHD